MKVDFYFSYRSPYSYFILPRLKKLIEDFASEYDKPKVNKFQVTEAIRNFARVGKQLQVNNGIMEAAKQLAEMADNAQHHVLGETNA